MRMVGLKGRAQEGIFKLLAGILHLGNIKFDEKGDGSVIANPETLDQACEFIGTNSPDLKQALLFRHIETRGEAFDVPQNPMQVWFTSYNRTSYSLIS